MHIICCSSWMQKRNQRTLTYCATVGSGSQSPCSGCYFPMLPPQMFPKTHVGLHSEAYKLTSPTQLKKQNECRKRKNNNFPAIYYQHDCIISANTHRPADNRLHGSPAAKSIPEPWHRDLQSTHHSQHQAQKCSLTGLRLCCIDSW